MFTGIVERVGVVRAISETTNGRRVTIAGAEGYLSGVRIGDSIAIDGVCQTVVTVAEDAFEVEAIRTTLSRTTFGRLAAGDRVNLERAMTLGDRLGGHLVQGHVDGTGVIQQVERVGDHVLLQVRMPPEVAEVTVLHGSIAIHGVSLTVNALPGDDTAEVALIPHTWENTSLQYLAAGDEVNLEGDMLGRFVVGYLRRIAMTLPLREL
ncbi:MAG: riboflavin synthase [Longimicrobiales bacterium]